MLKGVSLKAKLPTLYIAICLPPSKGRLDQYTVYRHSLFIRRKVLIWLSLSRECIDMGKEKDKVV